MTWTKEWPKEPGHYWFYGWSFRDRSRSPELHLVEVFRGSNSMVYVTKGHFLYKNDGAGLWAFCDLPNLPNKEEMNEFQSK